MTTGCQKSNTTAAPSGGVGGGGTTNDGEINYEVSGIIADTEEPVDFVQSIASVEIGGVNLSSSTAKFNISAFYLSPLGKKTLVYQGTFNGNRFSFKSKVPKHLIVVEAVRVSDGGKFAGLLPPPMRSLLAKLRMTRTSFIAAKMAGMIADKAASGNAVARSALETNSLSVADVLTAAQSVRRTVDEQQSKGSGSAIDLSALAIKLAEKSNERLSALAAEGQSTESVAAKISEKTYESVFGENAETTSPGVLAHRTKLDLGTSTAATKDVAYEAIKALGTESTKIVDEAFRVEATTYREASSVTAAVAAESTVASQFSIKFDACQANISSCAAVVYTPPPVSSGGSSSGGTTGGSTLPVITINTQPSNQTAANGSASFSVSASVTNSATLSYQWQKQESGSGSFINVSGATNATLVLSSLTNAADNGDVYRVVVSATGGASSVTSSSATLTVDPCAADGWCVGEMIYYLGGQATTLDINGSGTWNSQTYTAGVLKSIITISSQPSNQAAVNGSASFSVSASVTNGATLSYQWQKQESGIGDFSNVSGATNATLVLSSLTSAADNGDVYRVVVSATGGAASVTSSSATLIVDPCAANGWCVGESKYYLSGQATSLDENGSGTWNDQTYAGGILKSVIEITSQPTNQTAVDGAASFSVSASVTNGATLSYQWQKQESGSGSFTDISGATSSTLILSSLTNTADDGDVYRVIVSATGGAASIESVSATLEVLSLPLYKHSFNKSILSNTAQSITVTNPAEKTIQAGDTLVVVVMSRSNITGITPGSWTTLGSTSGVVRSTYTQRVTVAYKTATGDPAIDNQVTITQAQVSRFVASILVFSGSAIPFDLQNGPNASNCSPASIPVSGGILAEEMLVYGYSNVFTPTWDGSEQPVNATFLDGTANEDTLISKDPAEFYNRFSLAVGKKGIDHDVTSASTSICHSDDAPAAEALRFKVKPYEVSTCPGDCYLEGAAPNYSQDLPAGTERVGPLGATMSLQFANGTSGFKIWKEKGGTKILNATGFVANGWQKALTRAGTSFSDTDFTTGSNIAGRVCPTHVFLSHASGQMTTENRCVYYDAGNAAQALNATIGIEAEDRLSNWNHASSGRGSSSSYYEGNIKTCADKGMRLPTMYETTMDNPVYSLPTGDGITPTFAGSTNGVPSTWDGGSDYTQGWNWTASAHGWTTTGWRIWRGTANDGVYPDGYDGDDSLIVSARCVLPSH